MEMNNYGSEPLHPQVHLFCLPPGRWTRLLILDLAEKENDPLIAQRLLTPARHIYAEVNGLICLAPGHAEH